MAGIGIAKKGLGLLGKKILKEEPKTIKSVAPNVPKTGIEKAQRTLKVEGHKIKAKISKIQSDIFLGKMKRRKGSK